MGCLIWICDDRIIELVWVYIIMWDWERFCICWIMYDEYDKFGLIINFFFFLG